MFGVELLDEVLLWLLALPLYPHFALLRDLSAWASVMVFWPFFSLGMVPTNLPTGLEVALGRPGVGLGSLGLLGPAWEAGDADPACPLVELEVIMALGDGLLPLASLAIAAFSACCCCHLCLWSSFTTATAPLWTEP